MSPNCLCRACALSAGIASSLACGVPSPVPARSHSPWLTTLLLRPSVATHLAESARRPWRASTALTLDLREPVGLVVVLRGDGECVEEHQEDHKPVEDVGLNCCAALSPAESVPPAPVAAGREQGEKGVGAAVRRGFLPGQRRHGGLPSVLNCLASLRQCWPVAGTQPHAGDPLHPAVCSRGHVPAPFQTLLLSFVKQGKPTSWGGHGIDKIP